MRRSLVILLVLAGCGARGDDASPESLRERALAALRAGKLSDAESAARGAAERGGPRFVPLRDFVLGNVAFERARVAAAQAETPEAEPFAWDAAIAYAEIARKSWELAAASRADWPEARRNVERALYALDDLAARKADAERRRRKGPRAEPRPSPRPAPGREPGAAGEAEAAPAPEPGAGPATEAAAKLQETPLDRAQVLQLLDRLAEKEREKLAARRARRAAAESEVEKDW